MNDVCLLIGEFFDPPPSKQTVLLLLELPDELCYLLDYLKV